MMDTELLIAAGEIRYAKSTVCVDCSSCIVLYKLLLLAEV